MKFDIRRFAAAGAVSALAAGALVAGTATTANAATASTDYSCNTPLGPQTIPTTFDVPALDAVPAVNAGTPFPAGIMDVLTGGPAVTMTFTLPAAVVPTLMSLGVTGIDSPDLAMGFGNSSVPATGLTLVGITPNPDGSASAVVQGTNGDFAAPAAGPQDVTMPSAFNLAIATSSAAVPVVPVSCSSATPAVMKTITVSKNPSAVVAKAPSQVKKGTTAKLKAVVPSAGTGYPTPTGKVIAKVDGNKIGSQSLNNGTAVFKVSKLSLGKHTFSVNYRGNGYYSGSKASKTFKVVR